MLLDEIEGRDLDLRPVETMLHAPPEEFQGMIRVGEPAVFDAVAYAAAAGETLDAGTRLQLEESEFFLVRLPLNIRPRERIDVRYLAVECYLEGTPGTPICWSMTPERVEQEINASTHASVNSELKVGVATVGASGSASADYVIYQPSIVAFGIGRDDAAWEFEPTQGRKLRGVQLLHLVVKSPRGGAGQGRVVIRADVIERGFIWNTKAYDRRDGADALVFPFRAP
jgi:hypothetical protein